MPSDEIGLAELTYLARQRWKLITGCAAIFGLLTWGWFQLVVDPKFSGTASVIVRPSLDESTAAMNTVDVYRTILESEAVVQETTTRLQDAGMLRKNQQIRQGRDLQAKVEKSSSRSKEAVPILQLSGLADSPELAAALANTWAQVLTEESRRIVPAAASEAGEILAIQIPSTREDLEKVELDRTQTMNRLELEEGRVAAEWDRRISAAKSSAARGIARYQTETRFLLEQAAGLSGGKEHAPVTGEQSSGMLSGDRIRAKLLEVVSVRVQQAQTPRILRLEKSATDETMADFIATETDVPSFDQTVTTEEVNLLYDQLTLRALDLENALKRMASDQLELVSTVLSALQKIQLERAAGMNALVDSRDLELKLLNRNGSRALGELERHRVDQQAEFARQHGQLTDLSARLTARYNAVSVGRLLGEVEVVHLAAPAVVDRRAEPIQLPLKIALAVFLGAVLGLMVALFRSVGQLETTES